MSKNKPNMTRRNILITGCSSGIGLAAAQILHRRGYHVIATVRKPADQSMLCEAGISSLLCDLNNSAAIRQMVESALKAFDGRIDVLFNNAAYGQPGAVEDLSREAMRDQFETNVFGTQELTNLVIRQMRQQGFGRIIYNSSVLGLIALPYRGAYNASKFAIEGLADTLRLELKGTGIDISLIEPGPITSHFRQNAFVKFQQHIDKNNSAHLSNYNAMERRLLTPGPTAPFTLPAKAVVDKLVHAIESNRPKIRYYVTFPTYLFAYLKRVLPASGLDWVLNRVSRGEQR
ncbi:MULTISPECIES: SDR family NAD(P)-dependent oxidoreductase [unclassified Methylophaga]|jgi:NAD(P)-dependent dehydrogenase (short-subunit alcohol dehydrogenase family)|uniref:SDR family NAD(P)-dependent oxidoreductase n=3 Tax=Methylophaga TaxID=40222 RepID=UPI000C9073F6|nr:MULTISPECIES: SDR family NAD(P)-dependent oxidoreductase [unclassified Methylophaga]MAK67394.1 short-chain dehydrogenase [Methylophaga sp.]MAY16934.1 short-chain dehydrogenase [Methylophaga sp.]MBN46551.1 short-chain dehydrogenase [Methylophaga sp.]HAO24247.1 short-chain dehydrogenase [Methylophaga sp.]HCD05549.1 short-chain dehydrogenase [Methylophaga sp.]|tara:strand:+ start:75446 stop:76312 length:867 start_codon:yes stop_codon:yes gene_type:complete